MTKLPGIKYSIDITTLDDYFVESVSLQHRVGGRIVKSEFSAKNLKKLAGMQHKVLTAMMADLLGKG